MSITKRLNTWHRYRVPVLEAMIALEGEIAYHRAEEQRLRPRYGETAVGSADFDHLLNATIAEEFIRVIRRGDTPEVACRGAKKASRDCITKWNSCGCGTVGRSDSSTYIVASAANSQHPTFSIYRGTYEP